MTALACARSLGFGHPPDRPPGWLVELRGIEPLTSAVRLPLSRTKMAYFCAFPHLKSTKQGRNRPICDTLAIHNFPGLTIRDLLNVQGVRGLSALVPEPAVAIATVNSRSLSQAL